VSPGQLAERLLAAFVAELEEQVQVMNGDLLALEATPGDAARLKSLFRVAHTLKGAARAAGVPVVEHACHRLETLLAKARDGKLTLGPDQLAMLFTAADALADAAVRLRAGRDLADAPVAELVDASVSGAAASGGAQAATAPISAPEHARGDGQVRVDAERIDALLAASGHLIVTGSRIANEPASLRALHDSAQRCATDFSRAGRRLRLTLERSGAPPALVQAVRDTEEQLRHVVRDAARLADAAEQDARALADATAAIADGVQRVRLRPFGEACEALPRVVRDVAAAGGKDAQLELRGGEVTADRAVLDGLREALLHLVRNAVDHGVEPPAERLRVGKPRRGTVLVAAALRGDRLIVSVTDDGAGLDPPAIRRQLEARGRQAPDDERELARTLLEGGMSSRGEVTAISGRGVGLDIVRAAVERIRGSVDLTWSMGGGTTITIECPPTLATIRAVLVEVGGHVLAIPTTHVERLLRVRPEDIRHAEGSDVITAGGAPVRLLAIARLLPPLAERATEGPVAVVLLRAGERRLAAAVDGLLAEQEIVWRPLSALHGSLPCVSGAAMLGTGRVALVLDPPAVVDAGLALAPGAGLAVAEGATSGPVQRRILVVDDSITTRTLQQSILEAAGYDVRTAVDGADGWRSLQEHGADLVVADVEMPRMDGFALCESIRGSRRFKPLPVVLVTALETPEHRARGLEVGADAYIGKSSFDQQHLLDTISQLLG